MNSFLVIAVLVLTGFSLASAASLNFGDYEIPELKGDFEESLQALLSHPTKQLMDFDSFGDFDANTEHVHDQWSLETAEKDESEAVKVISTTDDNGICTWKSNHVGVCCKLVHFRGVPLSTCVVVKIFPRRGMGIILIVNKHVIVRHFVRNKHRYRVCKSRGDLKLCWLFHNIIVTSDHAQMCMMFGGKYQDHTRITNLGCIQKKISEIESANESSMKLSQVEQNEEILSIQEEDMQTDEIFNFKQ